ncbi:MAG: hypothetical protein JNL53_19625 [Cyclobacteriaceae bacterium]|nr:hypothetical protein [Cyclobacteriaceae bacterium]
MTILNNIQAKDFKDFGIIVTSFMKLVFTNSGFCLVAAIFLTQCATEDEPKLPSSSPVQNNNVSPDRTPPVLTIDPASLKIIPFGKFKPVFKAMDDRDGDVSSRVKIVKVSKNFGKMFETGGAIIQTDSIFTDPKYAYHGEQKVTFSVSDLSGNVTEQIHKLEIGWPLWLSKSWCSEKGSIEFRNLSGTFSTADNCATCIRISADKKYIEMYDRIGQILLPTKMYATIDIWDIYQPMGEQYASLNVRFSIPEQYTTWRYNSTTSTIIGISRGKGNAHFYKVSDNEYHPTSFRISEIEYKNPYEFVNYSFRFSQDWNTNLVDITFYIPPSLPTACAPTVVIEPYPYNGVGRKSLEKTNKQISFPSGTSPTCKDDTAYNFYDLPKGEYQWYWINAKPTISGCANSATGNQKPKRITLTEQCTVIALMN